jgi:hypothetical protein
MKEEILKVAKHLEDGVIDEEKAKSMLLMLFGVTSQIPLTPQRVGKMLDGISRETWVAVQGDAHGWKEWFEKRNKQYIN